MDYSPAYRPLRAFGQLTAFCAAAAVWAAAPAGSCGPADGGTLGLICPQPGRPEPTLRIIKY